MSEEEPTLSEILSAFAVDGYKYADEAFANGMGELIDTNKQV